MHCNVMKTVKWMMGDVRSLWSIYLSLALAGLGPPFRGAGGWKGSVEPMQHKTKVKVHLQLCLNVHDNVKVSWCNVGCDEMMCGQTVRHRKYLNLTYCDDRLSIVLSTTMCIVYVRLAAFHNSQISWHSERCCENSQPLGPSAVGKRSTSPWMMQGRYILRALKKKTKRLSCKTYQEKENGLSDHDIYHTPWLRNQGRQGRVSYDFFVCISCHQKPVRMFGRQVSSCVFPFSSSSGPAPPSGNRFLLYFFHEWVLVGVAPQRNRGTPACLLHGPLFATKATNVLKKTWHANCC